MLCFLFGFLIIFWGFITFMEFSFFSGILAEIFSPLKLNYHKNSRLYFFVRKVTNSVVNSANNYFSHYMQSYQKNKSKKGKKFPSEKPLLQFYFVWQKTVMAFPRGFFFPLCDVYIYICVFWLRWSTHSFKKYSGKSWSRLLIQLSRASETAW